MVCLVVGRSASEAEQLLLLSPFDRQVRREEELAIDIPGLGALDDRFDNPRAEPRETQEASEMGPAAPFALADLVKAEVGVGLDKLQSGVRVSQQCEQVVFHWLSGRSAIDPQLRFAERLAGRKGDAETPAWLIGELESGGLEGKIKTAALHLTSATRDRIAACASLGCVRRVARSLAPSNIARSRSACSRFANRRKP